MELKKTSSAIFTLTLLLFLSSCQKPNNNVPMNGTVDGGGGNVLCQKDGSSCSILDLIENKEKIAFDFDLRTLAEQDFRSDVSLLEKNLTATVFYNGDSDLKDIFKDNADFFIWYLNQVKMSNSEFENTDKSLRFIGTEAFGLDAVKVKNLQFYFTEKEIPLLNDQGFIGIENPTDLKQVALQDKFGQVLINKNYFSKLDFKNKFALLLHESILYILIQTNPAALLKNGTSKIRQFVNSFTSYRFSKISSQDISPVGLEKLRTDFDALEIPKQKALYELIGQVSDSQQNANLVCNLKREIYKSPLDGSPQKTANYRFEKNGKKVSNEYSMDIEFMMKIQIYLVKRGLCVFKPSPCEIKQTENEVMKEFQGYAIHIDGEVMPEINKDLAYIQEFVFPKYRLARICQ